MDRDVHGGGDEMIKDLEVEGGGVVVEITLDGGMELVGGGKRDHSDSSSSSCWGSSS